MRIAVLGALALLIAAPLPAHAADPATLGCVMETLDPATRAVIEEDARARFGGGGAQASTERMEGIRQAARACAKRHGWSDAAWEAAALHSAAAISLEVAAPLLRKAGIDPDRFAVLFAGLPPSIRERDQSTPAGSPPPEFVAMMEKGLADGVFTLDDASMPLLTELLAMLLVRDSSRADFLRS